VGEFKAPNKFKYYDKGILIDEQKPAGESFIQTDAQVIGDNITEQNNLLLKVEVDSSV
jgi:hypothetical protein